MHEAATFPVLELLRLQGRAKNQLRTARPPFGLQGPTAPEDLSLSL